MNITPNTYVVRYTDYGGEEYETEIDALTKDEAITLLIARTPVGKIKSASATPKPREKAYKFSDLFH